MTSDRRFQTSMRETLDTYFILQNFVEENPRMYLSTNRRARITCLRQEED